MIEEAARRLQILLHGRVPESFDLEGIDDDTQQALAKVLNGLFAFMQEVQDFIVPLSRGELFDLKVGSGNFLASPFKELHSRLLHLTWQAERVANGDYRQRVDFMGDFSEAFNSMIRRLSENENLLKRKIEELEEALEHIGKLEDMLPICSSCKRVRVEGGDPKDQESWVQIESYLTTKTSAQFSHGICPECLQKLYPGVKRKAAGQET